MKNKILAMAASALILSACNKPAGNEMDKAVEIGEPTLFTKANDEAQRNVEKTFLSKVSVESLYKYHDMLASVPHVAGSVGDWQVIDSMAKAFEEMGLEVEVHEFWALLPTPVAASLEITSPDKLTLNLFQDVIEGDEYTNNAKVEFGYNGYSGSGTVESEIVYVNRGTKADFDHLKEMGISLEGKIAFARYGGNYRGYKAKFAEEAGAIGLLIFTDPADTGYAVALPYPEGPGDTSTSMQWGSLLTGLYEGDPLTPGYPATEDAERLDPANVVGLPKIPVQPISWGAAEEILFRMTGEAIREQSWQGGLPMRYRLTGGPDLKVKLMVDQKWEIKKSASVLGTLRGSQEPEKKIIIGSHHDAWIYGAIDPQAGTISVMETARIASEMAKEGILPKRSLVFAGWGAEEQGLIGSTEWVEANLDDLKQNAVAYINLDAAAQGPYLSASGSPSIQRVVVNAASRIPHGEGSLLDHWLNGRDNNAKGLTRPRFGNMGGGSDHTGFIALAAVPALGLNGSGDARGIAHSFYDNLNWYRQNVGSDYKSAQMITNIVGVTAYALANSDLIDLDIGRYVNDTKMHLESLSGMKLSKEFLTLNEGQKIAADFHPIMEALARFQKATAPLLAGLDATKMSAEEISSWNKKIMAMEDLWLKPDGLPDRPFYQNMFGATDGNAGYAAWMLPNIRWAIEYQDKEYLNKVIPLYVSIFDDMTNVAQGN